MVRMKSKTQQQLEGSDADDLDEITEPGELVGAPGVEGEAVGVRSGGNEQGGDTPAMRPARLGHGGHDLSIAPSRGGVEGGWLEVASTCWRRA